MNGVNPSSSLPNSVAATPMTPDTHESTLWHGTPSQWTNFGTYLVCMLLAGGIIYAKTVYTGQGSEYILFTLAVPLLWALGKWIGTATHRYEITTERIKLTE